MLQQETHMIEIGFTNSTGLAWAELYLLHLSIPNLL